MAESAARLIKRDDGLRATQSQHRLLWQDIADFVLPYRSNIIAQRLDGQKQTKRLFDSTAPQAVGLLAASLNSSMTPATQPWLSLKMRQADLNDMKEVQDWLEDCARRIHQALRQSTFNQAVHEMYLDLASFGTGAILVDERSPSVRGEFGGFRFLVPAIATYTIAEDHYGQVDTCFRRFMISLGVAAARWDLGPDLMERARLKRDEPLEILHAVTPRRDRAYGADNRPQRGAKNMPWASCYIAVQTKRVLEEGGHEEFPYAIPRWSKTSGEVYGRGPSHTALPDIATLNAAKELILKAAPLAMQPPTVERDDAVVGEIKLNPGGRNVVTGPGPLEDNLAFLVSRQRVDLSQLVLTELRQGIRSIYFTDQLVLHEKPDMTATEVLALQEQMQRLLGPTTGRLEAEFLNPLVQRCFGIMARAHALLPLPDALREVAARDQADLDIEYEGPLARAQRTIELHAQDRVTGFVQSIAQARAATPDPLWDVLDLDKMLRDRAEITGLPSNNLKSQEEVDAKRVVRADQQQKQVQLDDITKASEIAKNAAGFMQAMQPNGGPSAAGATQTGQAA